MRKKSLKQVKYLINCKKKTKNNDLHIDIIN